MLSYLPNTGANRRLQWFHIVSLLASLLFVVLVADLAVMKKCDMAGNLKELFLFTVSSLNNHGIQYWLDYGTLLGQRRDNAIIPWEFDLDLGVPEEECARISELKPIFSARGHTMYDRTDYISKKARWGYSPYLHTPCIRIYDQNDAYYVDLYWYKRLTETQARNQSVDLPSLYVGGEVLCNDEGFNHDMPGGCRQASSLFPLSTVSFLGVEVSVPKNADEALTDMYGDDFMVSKPKGYKAFFCLYMPTDNLLLLHASWLLLGVVWAFAFYIYAWPSLRERFGGGRAHINRHEK